MGQGSEITISVQILPEHFLAWPWKCPNVTNKHKSALNQWSPEKLNDRMWQFKVF